MTTFSEELAEFIVGCEEPAIAPEAREIVRRAAVDTLGCAIAGSRHPAGELISTVMGEGRPRDHGATAWNGTGRLPLLEACAVNGTLSHALDFDDTNHPLHGHPSCHLLPVVVAIAEHEDMEGRDAVSAYLIGHETEVALARAFNMALYAQGFHPTGTLGTFGACGAACRLLGLDVEATVHALALAATMAAGIRANVGTMIKPLHSGMASMHGVLAARLAQRGWKGAADVFERPGSGFAASHMTQGKPLYGKATASLGKTWAILQEFGYQVKQFPSCGATQPPTEAAINLHQRLGDRVDEIVRVELGVTELATIVLIYDRPRDGNEARFSLPHGVARGLVSGAVTLEDFTDERVHDADLLRVMEKVRYFVDPRLDGNTEFGANLRVELSDGEVLEENVLSASGNSDHPLAPEALAEKFFGCLGDRSDASRRLWRSWSAIDGRTPVRSLIDELDAWWGRSDTADLGIASGS